MSGYCDYSKSNNAINAEQDGKFPASIIARKLGVETGAVKEILTPCEWHHTSSWYNSTDYYDLEDAEEKLSELKAFKSDKTEKIYHHCTVKYLEWSGTRKHPTASEVVLKNRKVMVKGQFATFNNACGKPMRKKISANGFEIIERGN